MLHFILSVNLFAKAFGGWSGDWAYSITPTSYGGFAVAGWTESFGAGGADFLVLKLSQDGSLEWAKTFGGWNWDWAYSITQTSDGGFAVAGWAGSLAEAGLLILKLSGDGSLQWAKAFGGGGCDYASITQASAGGFVVAGDTRDFGAGDWDLLVLTLNPDGSYPGCVQDVALAEQTVSPTVTTPSLSVSSPSLQVSSPSVSVSDVSPSVEDACPPGGLCEFAASGFRYSPIPGGLLFSCDEPTQVKIYFPDGRLAESLLVDREARVYLKPGVYFVSWPGGRGAAPVR